MIQENGLESWQGLNVLQHKAGRVSALDMGVYPQVGGYTTNQIIKAAREGKLHTLIVYGDTGNALTPADVKNVTKMVYIGTHQTPLSEVADVVLPVAAYTEKNALWANTEGRVQEAFAAVPPPLQAKEDWKVFRAASEILGKTLPFDTQTQLRQKMADYCPAYGPELYGKLLPAPWHGEVGKVGKMTDKPLAGFSAPFYRSNLYLQNSATMARCQAESSGTPATAQQARLSRLKTEAA